MDERLIGGVLNRLLEIILELKVIAFAGLDCQAFGLRLHEDRFPAVDG